MNPTHGPATAEPHESLRQLRIAVDTGDWKQAEIVGRSVLLHYPDDADALELLARAAHGKGEQSTAGDLMLDACRAEGFSSPQRIREAIANLLAAGRFYDALQLLESGIARHPDNFEFRRMLFQMNWGVEDRPRSLPHGRHLILNRQFDFDLLLAIGTTEARTESADSLTEMTRRHQRDNRPRIAEARLEYDRGHTDRAAEILTEIVKDHPDHAPAVSLLARTLCDAGEHERLSELLGGAHLGIDDYPNTWIAKGDWCQSQRQFDRAARAYWEAAKRDPPSRTAWLKLSFAFQQLENSTPHGLTSLQLSSISDRVVRLTRLSQLKAEFVRSDKRSPRLAIEIAEVLFQLGQPWEAEAWSAIATTLPEADQEAKVASVRDSIIKSLRRDTPWQVTESDAAFELDLTHLPTPSVTRLAGDSTHPVAPTADSRQASLTSSRPILLIDESHSRSLVFAGHTGQNLDEPGIRHFQTLGCGGGTIDYDLDGWSDLYLAAAGGTPMKENSQSNAFWRNVGGTFHNVTLESHSHETGFTQGIAVGDVNEDGFPDLVVLNYGENSLLINNGDGTFTDSSEVFEGDELKAEWSSSAAIADINRDGLADVVIVNYGSGDDPVTKECRHATTQVVRACSPLVFPGCRDRFLVSDGFRLVDRTDQCGEPPVVGRGLGVLVAAFTSEPGPGILIANDLTSNHYWSRPSDASRLLDESAILRGLGSDDRAPAQGSMGIAGGDFDSDGDLDVYVTNFQSEANTYHEQMSEGLWRDQTATQRLDVPTLPMVGFGTAAVDFDNDGVLELIVSNGHVDDYPPESSSPYAQPMQLFQRQPSGGYRSVGESMDSDYLRRPHVGRSLWTIDANRDHCTDVVVTHQTEPVALLINRTEPRCKWIELRLIGRDCSRDAIGTTVKVWGQSDKDCVTAFRTAGDGYLCSNESLLRIGLGEATTATRVEVRWPDGGQSVFEQLESCRSWLIVQSEPQAFRLAE